MILGGHGRGVAPEFQPLEPRLLLSVAPTSGVDPEEPPAAAPAGASAFTDIGAGLVSVRSGAVAWGDYNQDGDLDLALAGYTPDGVTVGKIYRNDVGIFTDIGAGLTGIWHGTLAWGDYDNDGDLDLAAAGYETADTRVSKVYRNDAGSFTDIGAALPGVASSSLAWGDYDNDGDLDLALAGWGGGSGRVSHIYRNDGGSFTDIGAGLAGVSWGSVAWGDYDNDGDLDLALAGNSDSGEVSRIYRNDGGVFNVPPAAPMNLSAGTNGSAATLSWSASSDPQTPAAGLSYNVRVGTSPGDDDVFCGMAELSTGRRRLPAMGNARENLSWTLKGLDSATYYWSVQAVDTAYAGSAWAAEDSFTVVGPDVEKPTADLSHPIDGSTIPLATINVDERYIDVTFDDQGGSNLNISTITDEGHEFTLSGPGVGTVAISSGNPSAQGGGQYRYSFTGDFVRGQVDVNFTAGAWADNAGNTH